jgi:hypothetical protein
MVDVDGLEKQAREALEDVNKFGNPHPGEVSVDAAELLGLIERTRQLEAALEPFDSAYQNGLRYGQSRYTAFVLESDVVDASKVYRGES